MKVKKEITVIHVVRGAKTKIAKELGCNWNYVSDCLIGKYDTPKGDAVRRLALKKYSL